MKKFQARPGEINELHARDLQHEKTQSKSCTAKQRERGRGRLAIESNMIAVGGRSRQTALRQVAASASRHVCHKSASWRRGKEGEAVGLRLGLNQSVWTDRSLHVVAFGFRFP